MDTDPNGSTKTAPAPYTAANSGGSNLGPTAKAMVDRVTEDANKLAAEDPARRCCGRKHACSAGTGRKTYGMLTAAHVRLREKINVDISIHETHGWAETEALIHGPEIVLRRVIPYRGLLARHPRRVPVDEPVHTNVPGSRHPKAQAGRQRARVSQDLYQFGRKLTVAVMLDELLWAPPQIAMS